MSFATIEISREEGQPASLYLIQWGSAASSYFAYTDAEAPITFDGITYEPIPIGRSNYEASGTLDRKALDISLTPNAGICRMYATNPPSEKVGMTIRQGHLNDPLSEWPVAWTGVIKNVNWEPPLAKIVAEPLDTVLARPGLRRHYMYGCPHVLYGDQCKANKEVLKRTLTPTAIGENYVEFAPGWHGSVAAADYIGGYMEWTDADGNRQVKTALKRGTSDNQILIGTTYTLTLTTTLFFYAGCRRTKNACRDLHNNIVNFGGQPWIPSFNPVSYVNRYY